MLSWTSFMFLSVVLLLTSSPFLSSLMLASAIITLAVYMASAHSLWLAYSSVILFVGGMMVLFLYVSSFSISKKMIINKATGGELIGALGTIFLVSTSGKILGLTPLPFTSPSWLFTGYNVLLLFFLGLVLMLGLLVSVMAAFSEKGALKTQY